MKSRMQKDFNEWDFDFIKIDWCGGYNGGKDSPFWEDGYSSGFGLTYAEERILRCGAL